MFKINLWPYVFTALTTLNFIFIHYSIWFVMIYGIITISLMKTLVQTQYFPVNGLLSASCCYIVFVVHFLFGKKLYIVMIGLLFNFALSFVYLVYSGVSDSFNRRHGLQQEEFGRTHYTQLV